MKKLYSILTLLLAFSANSFSQVEDPYKPDTWGFIDVTINTIDTYWDYVGDSEHPLPCELLEFEGNVSNEGTMLKWVTVSETNTDAFIIEKLNEKNIWEHIDLVKASGNSNSVQEYSFSQVTVSAVGTIYRLVLRDNDGSERAIAQTAVAGEISVTSEITDVRIASNEENITLFWDCANDDTNTSVSVYNTNGQQMYNTSISSLEGINYAENIALESGNVYIVVIETIHQRFVQSFGL